MLRYFPNVLPDFGKGEVELNQDHLKHSVEEITTKILTNFPANDKNAEDGLYLGAAGVAYMFYYLSKVPSLRKQQHLFIGNAVEYIQPALHVAAKCETKTKHLPSFLLGNSGIYAVASAIYHASKDLKLANFYREKFLRIAPVCKNPFLDSGEDELFVGRAGYLCAALWMSKETDSPLALNDLYDICNAIVASGRAYSKHNRSIAPLMYAYYNTEYLGAGHGLSSILQMLMCVPGYLDAHSDEASDIKESVDCLLSVQTEDGNFACVTDELNLHTRREEDELVHWCHGASGVVYLMARAYIVWSDQKYLRSCEKSANLVWRKGLLRKGPGICHGVAGNGYVFLLVYRLTNDMKYLHRAMAFAQFMNMDDFKLNSRTPDNPYSLYEGIAGTACFLADLTQPNIAVFPFSDIF